MMNSLTDPKVVDCAAQLPVQADQPAGVKLGVIRVRAQHQQARGEEVTSYSPSTLHASINASCQQPSRIQVAAGHHCQRCSRPPHRLQLAVSFMSPPTQIGSSGLGREAKEDI